MSEDKTGAFLVGALVGAMAAGLAVVLVLLLTRSAYPPLQARPLAASSPFLPLVPPQPAALIG